MRLVTLVFAAAGCAVEGHVYAERQESPSLVGEHQFDVRINLATDLNGSSLAVGQTSRREPYPRAYACVVT
jgi:hypothetical protein